MAGRATSIAGGVLFVLGVLCLPVSVQALEVRVLSESALQLEAQAAGTTLTLNGSLRDDSGQAVPVQRLGVRVRRGDETVTETELTSGYHGEFSFYQELAPGRYQVEVTYSGGSYLRGSAAGAEVELEPSQARLRAEGPDWVVGETSEVWVKLQATSQGRGLPGYITGIVGDRPFATVELDGRGRGEIDLGSHLLSGENTFRFRLDGSPYRQPLLRTVKIRRSPEVRLSGEVETVHRRFERGVELDLSVVDEFGPVEGARVEVSLQGVDDAELMREISTELSDARGRIHRFIPFEEMGGETWQVVARAVPDVGESLQWEGPQVHEEVSLVERVVRVLAWIALVLSAIWLARRLVSGGVLWLRRSILRWKAQRVGLAEVSREEEELFASVEHRVVEQVSEESPVGPEVLWLEVWDPWQKRVPGRARIVLADGRSIRFDGAGRIELPAEYRDVRVEAPGYLPVETSLTEHRGGVYRISMTAVPLKIRELYRYLVRRLKDQDLWGKLTPRQIEALLRPLTLEQDVRERSPGGWESLLETWEELPQGERAGRLLDVMTDLVEESSFSGRVYSVETWERTRQIVQELLELLTWSKAGGHDVTK